MESSPNLIVSAISGVVAQRLVKNICKDCCWNTKANTDWEEIFFARRDQNQSTQIRSPRGAVTLAVKYRISDETDRVL